MGKMVEVDMDILLHIEKQVELALDLAKKDEIEIEDLKNKIEMMKKWCQCCGLALGHHKTCGVLEIF